MQTVPALQPRAARQSEWLRSALAHHHCPDPGVENEIVVLATGIDQYLQEVFHHLAYSNRDDVVSAEDFTVLCAVLGLAGEGRGAQRADEEENHGVCSGLPRELSFKDFHSRLCGVFRVRAYRNGTGAAGAARLPVAAETEHVEREIRLRWPRVRQRKCVSFDLSKDQTGGNRPGLASNGRNSSRDENCREMMGSPGQKCETEAAALRELVEDMRCALQSSDARCLALEVALRQERGPRALTADPSKDLSSNALSSSGSKTATPSEVAPPTSQRGSAGTPHSQGRGPGVGGERGGAPAKRPPGRRDPGDPLVRELKLIRSSRDGQLEEAIRFNQRLEEELGWAYQEARRREGVESRLRKENAEIRRRAEEAREALKQGLERVRLIQEQAWNVPALQTRVTQLETQLQEYRSRCTCRSGPAPQPQEPIERDDTCLRTDEGLQRAVEGRAASDEEEEERGTGETLRGECCLVEAKKLINRLHSTVKGGSTPTVHHPGPPHSLHHPGPPHSLHQENSLVTAARDDRGRGRKLHNPAEDRGHELEKRCEGVEGLEAQTMDTERARLSLLEKKLTDALTLLLQLRNKNVSRRALGKVLMDTLDPCSSSRHGPHQTLQVDDAL